MRGYSIQNYGCRVATASTLSLAFVALLAGSLVQASELAARSFRLTAKPSICVSYDSQIPCEMSMQVHWEASESSSVCLREAGSEPVVHCWEDALRGSIELAYSDTSDVTYQLVDAAGGELLAEASVVVINRDLHNARKNRRHVWSIL